ncbi:sphingomyelin phosphodiesterase [Heliocybe sulcata]|uniref:Sphingomyelin phosphodiesterase n=1 Tax=Heliocybe sulcata TaxID=5364 RepID=A0A5C3NFS2_9AGAM|nr:sphingomyelin phosphodiesterase [Heliocybe sulcata]
MAGFAKLAGALAVGTVAAQSTFAIQPSTYTVPGAFPTSLYSSYYNNPTATSAQVQPVVSDPVTHETYPFSLTDPDNIPSNDTADPHPLPSPAPPNVLLAHAIAQLDSIAANPQYASSCARCQASLEVAKFIALTAPQLGPEFAVAACEHFNYSTTCEGTYGKNALGSVLTQVAAYADVGGYDGQALCHNFLSLCPAPATLPLNLTSWFAKPKPNPLPPPKTPSGDRLRVLHISDAHIDIRYATHSEANCTSGICCRANNYNHASPEVPLFPAPRYGTYSCDSPISLVTSALEAIPPLTGTEETGFAWTLFTGDLVSHDAEYQLSRSYVEYAETMLYDLFKRMLGSGPVYAVLGNHDSYDQAQDAPYSIGGPLASQFTWNYDHVSSLWQYENWISETTAEYASTHYSAYMVRRADGLRVITLNTNLWYRANYFSYINMTHPDTSGMLRFLTDELQAAEDAGDRVWIMGHVLSGWDGTNGLLNPTNLFYQIVDRYTPHVIANIFWGHTHEDELSIFYSNNATNISAETAQVVSWVGPSITPLTNLNSGFRVYEVDSATFDIVDAYTWRSDVNSFPSLDNQTEAGPTYVFEYSTREAYGANITGWGPDDPLNGTWWHLVTEAMEADPSLVTTFNTYQGKSSVRSPSCTGTCVTAKICYLRSGSSSIAVQNCPAGYGSVQS